MRLVDLMRLDKNVPRRIVGPLGDFDHNNKLNYSVMIICFLLNQGI